MQPWFCMSEELSMQQFVRQHYVGMAGLRRVGCAGFALLLAGCASDPGSFQPGNSSVTDKMANLLAFNTTSPPPIAPAAKEIVKVDCPTIEIQDGTAAARYYAGAATNENVRYQFSLGNIARECTVVDNKILIKVGVSGRAILGPAGTAGTFSAPVRVAIRQESDGKAVVSKLYTATATVTSVDAGSGEFSLVTEPMAVPMLREQADQDYTVLVGFDMAGKAAAVPHRKPRKK
eukprot:gene9608-9685_t